MSVTPDRAIEIMDHLANGVNPFTGEILPNDFLYQHPDIIRTFHSALKCLEAEKKRRKNLSRKPDNHGKAWGEAEETTIKDLFKSGNSIKDISKKTGRTDFSIRARLVKMGLIDTFYIDHTGRE